MGLIETAVCVLYLIPVICVCPTGLMFVVSAPTDWLLKLTGQPRTVNIGRSSMAGVHWPVSGRQLIELVAALRRVEKWCWLMENYRFYSPVFLWNHSKTQSVHWQSHFRARISDLSSPLQWHHSLISRLSSSVQSWHYSAACFWKDHWHYGD